MSYADSSSLPSHNGLTGVTTLSSLLNPPVTKGSPITTDLLTKLPGIAPLMLYVYSMIYNISQLELITADSFFPTLWVQFLLMFVVCFLHPFLMITSTIYIYQGESAPPPSRKLQLLIIALGLFFGIVFSLSYTREDCWPLRMSEDMAQSGTSDFYTAQLMSNSWISLILAVLAFMFWQHMRRFNHANSFKEYVSTISFEYFETFVFPFKYSMLPAVIQHLTMGLLYYSAKDVHAVLRLTQSRHFFFLPYFLDLSALLAYVAIHAFLLRIHGHILDTFCGKAFAIVVYLSSMFSLMLIIAARSNCDTDTCHFEMLGDKPGTVDVSRNGLDRALARIFFAWFFSSISAFLVTVGWWRTPDPQPEPSHFNLISAQFV